MTRIENVDALQRFPIGTVVKDTAGDFYQLDPFHASLEDGTPSHVCVFGDDRPWTFEEAGIVWPVFVVGLPPRPQEPVTDTDRPYRDHTTSSLIDLYTRMVAQLDGIDSYDMDDIQAWQRLAAVSDCVIDYANEIMLRFDDHAKNILDEAVAKQKEKETARQKAKEQQQCES